MQTEIQALLCRLRQNKDHDQPLLVGLDGLSGAGKTTFVQKLQLQLENILPITIIHIDDFIVESNKRYNTEAEPWYEYYFLQWDVEKLTDSLFQKVAQGASSIALHFYNKETDQTYLKQLHLPANSILLVEGVFLQREAWRAYFDYVIYLDCPREIREQRTLTRDTYIGDFAARLHKYETRYWPAEAYYLQTIKPLEKADLVYHYN